MHIFKYLSHMKMLSTISSDTEVCVVLNCLAHFNPIMPSETFKTYKQTAKTLIRCHSKDPDKIPQYVASHQGLHCLLSINLFKS